jgi:hypothetical protein
MGIFSWLNRWKRGSWSFAQNKHLSRGFCAVIGKKGAHACSGSRAGCHLYVARCDTNANVGHRSSDKPIHLTAQKIRRRLKDMPILAINGDLGLVAYGRLGPARALTVQRL